MPQTRWPNNRPAVQATGAAKPIQSNHPQATAPIPPCHSETVLTVEESQANAPEQPHGIMPQTGMPNICSPMQASQVAEPTLICSNDQITIGRDLKNATQRATHAP